MAGTLLHTERLVVETCWCGIGHAIPEHLHRMAMENGTTVYCPLGHKWVVTESETTRLRHEKAALERRLQGKDDTIRRYRDNLEAERRSKAAIAGHLTRAKKRIAAGVCPAPGCKRSGFDDVRAHLASVHPDWVHEHPDVLA